MIGWVLILNSAAWCTITIYSCRLAPMYSLHDCSHKDRTTWNTWMEVEKRNWCTLRDFDWLLEYLIHETSVLYSKNWVYNKVSVFYDDFPELRKCTNSVYQCVVWHCVWPGHGTVYCCDVLTAQWGLFFLILEPLNVAAIAGGVVGGVAGVVIIAGGTTAVVVVLVKFKGKIFGRA